MATVLERLAGLEQRERELRRRVDTVENRVGGGGDVPYDESVRGRLHKLETVAAAAVLRRNLGVGLLKGWERSVLLIVAVATAAAAWYSALGH